VSINYGGHVRHRIGKIFVFSFHIARSLTREFIISNIICDGRVCVRTALDLGK
jgi:hypothetical protein